MATGARNKTLFGKALDSIGVLLPVRLSTFTSHLVHTDFGLFILVSTALFTGVYLADVLDYVRPIRTQAKHVIFEGADLLPNGPYGTSQRLSWASSREKGMLIGQYIFLELESFLA